MKKSWHVVLGLLAVIMCFSLFTPSVHAAQDLTTKYRVYQFDRSLKEFANEQEAIAYARQYAFSYVEEIGTRRWIYYDFPRYEVKQLDIHIGTYRSLEEAKAEASKWSYSSIRDVHEPGWVAYYYPQYQLYQGDITFDHWKFNTLEEAQAEAVHWANAHIIDLNNNRWVWDNISEEKKAEFRERRPIYRVYQGDYTQDDWVFGYMEDAIAESLKWANSHIINETNGRKIFSNEYNYYVYQNTMLLRRFVNIEEAIAYASLWANASIRTTSDREIWTNRPFYQVQEANKRPVSFATLTDALDYALEQPKAWIVNDRGRLIWDNSKRIKYWAWTGSATDTTIKNQVSNTLGLDVISPTWFELADASGNVKDTSSPELVKWLKERGLEIHPLITNQFNSDLTTRFLSNKEAQAKYINTIVNRTAELGLDGINIDFENMKGSDRDAYTEFVRDFTEAAHKKGLKISIDLPRGSVSWNHLTAFDHAELAHIVDYIVTMTYDHHYSGSPTPGSVAGLDWTEKGVQEFLSYGIPRDKLIMGIPFYIREWKLDQAGNIVSTRAIYSSAVNNIFATKDVTRTWDDRFGQYKIEYVEDGHTHVFWLEDENTIKERINIAKKYNLAAISAWRLGQEDPAFWQMMLLEK